MLDNQEEDNKQILDEIIDDIRHELIILDKAMERAERFHASARRARVTTINLRNLFKRYRKYTLLAYKH